MPYIGQGLQQGRRQLHTFTATASQTTFGVAYSPGYVDVYQNGILLAPSDYTATNGTTVVLAVGAAVNDEITIIAQHLFSVADVVSASQGGTFAGDVTMTGNLTVQGTTISVDTSTAQTLAMGDADKISLGDNADLQIYHEPTYNNGIIVESGSGNLLLGGNHINLRDSTLTTTMANFNPNSSADLYYAGTKVFGTTATGIDIANGTGTIFNNSGTFTIDANTNLTLRGGVHTFDNADGSVEYARIDTTGNVGIGESSPDTLLHISGAPDSKVITIDQNGRASAIGTYFSSGATDSRIDFYVSDGNTNGSSNNRMSIMGSGNVGIGTSNPAKRLDVFLPASTDGDTIRIARSNGAYYWHIGQTSSSVFYISNNDGDQHLNIAADGDIGIGTTPYANARLTIGGTEGGGYPAVLQFDNNNTSGAEFFMLATDTNWSAGSNKFIMGHGAPASSNADVTVDSNGYVGINTTSPQRALHIHDHAATGLHITNSQSGSGANDGFSQYIRDDNQATELMVRENSYLGFGTNNTLRAKILSSGEMFWPEISNRGDLTFPICSISNNGSGGNYLHVQFQSYGGVMFHIHFRGYEYIGASVREGSGGGYIYNTGGQNTAYSRGYSGHCVEVYQTTTNRIELVINTGSSQAGNRWGSYVFFGGTDTITGDTPLTLVQYGWNNSTGRLYSS